MKEIFFQVMMNGGEAEDLVDVMPKHGQTGAI